MLSTTHWHRARREFFEQKLTFVKHWTRRTPERTTCLLTQHPRTDMDNATPGRPVVGSFWLATYCNGPPPPTPTRSDPTTTPVTPVTCSIVLTLIDALCRTRTSRSRWRTSWGRRSAAARARHPCRSAPRPATATARPWAVRGYSSRRSTRRSTRWWARTATRTRARRTTGRAADTTSTSTSAYPALQFRSLVMVELWSNTLSKRPSRRLRDTSVLWRTVRRDCQRNASCWLLAGPPGSLPERLYSSYREDARVGERRERILASYVLEHWATNAEVDQAAAAWEESMSSERERIAIGDIRRLESCIPCVITTTPGFSFSLISLISLISAIAYLCAWPS